MSNPALRIVAALFAFVWSTSFAASAVTSGLPITIPASWTQMRSDAAPDYLAGVWFSPAPVTHAFKQNINVVKFASAQPLEAYVTDAMKTYLAMSPSLAIVSRRDTPGCAPGTGVLVDETSKTQNGIAIKALQSFVMQDGYVYIATYTRAALQDSDRDAERALAAMCSGAVASGYGRGEITERG